MPGFGKEFNSTLQGYKGDLLVDFDGTLATYDSWKGPTVYGQPIKEMIDRIKQWINEGYKVKIFTARACSTNEYRLDEINALKKWSKEHIGIELEVTAEKDFKALEIWDDRAVTVEFNTGKIKTIM